VIQAHLPVHLPCYDLAPLATFTLNGAPKGHRLRVPATRVA